MFAARAAGEIADDVHPAHFALHFTSTLLGVSYQWVVNPEAVDIYPFIEDVRKQMRLILRPTGQ
jgi:hypothetical protein